MEDDLFRSHLEMAAEDQIRSYDFAPSILDKTVISRIGSARKEGNLSFVLGAGISFASNICGWDQLVERSIERVCANSAISGIQRTMDGLKKSNQQRVRFLETALGIKAAFRSAMQHVLYEEYSSSADNPTIAAIANAALGLDGGPPVTQIVTYNFDNLLEISLQERIDKRSLSWKVCPVFSENSYRTSRAANTIRVYHPHGYIPLDARFGESIETPIVISETDYHKHYWDHSYWANAVQLNVFCRSFCLFIGLSFTDGNLRRLLDFVNFREIPPRKHVATMRLSSSADSSPPYAAEYVTEKDLVSLGVSPLWLRDWNEIESLIATIRQE